MGPTLPINLEDLLAYRGVESERVEFKASWDSNQNPMRIQFEVFQSFLGPLPA